MLAAVAYGGGVNRAAYSADGNTWTRATCPAGDWRRINSDGAGFVAVGTNGVIDDDSKGVHWGFRRHPIDG